MNDRNILAPQPHRYPMSRPSPTSTVCTPVQSVQRIANLNRVYLCPGCPDHSFSIFSTLDIYVYICYIYIRINIHIFRLTYTRKETLRRRYQ